MNTATTIIVRLTKGETQTFSGDGAVHFEFISQGLLFIEGAITKEIKKGDGPLPREIHYRNQRHWIPIAQIVDVHVLTHKTMDDPEEIKKYEAFKKHNIDIMITKISHTVSPTAEDIQKIEQEALKK